MGGEEQRDRISEMYEKLFDAEDKRFLGRKASEVPAHETSLLVQRLEVLRNTEEK